MLSHPRCSHPDDPVGPDVPADPSNLLRELEPRKLDGSTKKKEFHSNSILQSEMILCFKICLV